MGIRRSGIPWRLKVWQAWPRPKGRGQQTKEVKMKKKYCIINLAFLRKIRFRKFGITWLSSPKNEKGQILKNKKAK